MTDLEFVAMQNSPSVRSPGLPLAARLVRPAFAALSVLAPGLAASVAERVFLTAPRHPAPEHETAALAGARRAIVQVGDSPVSVWTWGHGPVVLLVHGWGGRGAQLARFVETLVASGCSVVTFDAPGHGAPPEPRAAGGPGAPGAHDSGSARLPTARARADAGADRAAARPRVVGAGRARLRAGHANAAAGRARPRRRRGAVAGRRDHRADLAGRGVLHHGRARPSPDPARSVRGARGDGLRRGARALRRARARAGGGYGFGGGVAPEGGGRGAARLRAP